MAEAQTLKPEIYSSRESIVMIGSDPIDGIQSIDWKVNRQRSDVYGISKNVRIGVEYGVKLVNGTIRVKSSIDALDTLLDKADEKDSMFGMTITLKKSGGVGSTNGPAGSKGDTFEFVFDQCYVDSVERSMDVNGVPISTYLFTAMDVAVK